MTELDFTAETSVREISLSPNDQQYKTGNIKVILNFPLLHLERLMSISFESEEIILKKLRERLRRMSDEELITISSEKMCADLLRIRFSGSWMKPVEWTWRNQLRDSENRCATLNGISV